MSFSSFVLRSLRYYWRTNLALSLGFASVVATLGGALLVGDSVRGSLARLVDRRLEGVHYVVSAPNFFRQQLASELGGTPLIFLDGKVEVYGRPSDRDISITAALAAKRNVKAGDTILVRVEKPSAIPKESLHGRKDDVGRTLRLRVASVGGEFSLRLQQGPVYAVYMPLARLQRELGVPGSINTILTTTEPPLEKVTLEDLGIRIRPQSVETASTIMSESLVKAAAGQPVFSYLANQIRDGDRVTPYSLVTAADLVPIKPDGILLNDWTAKDLSARVGDTVTLEYYLWESSGNLATRTSNFQLQSIVPIQGFAADRDLTPEYPGITQTKSIHDWDPPFPMNLGWIRPKDEEYWNRYRTTPKAFIAYDTGRRLWGSRFGVATSVRVATTSAYAQQLRDRIDPAQLGMVVMDIRKSGREASQGSTDFGEYFAYFSFFVLASALILAGLLFRLGIEQRMREIGMLRSLGWSSTRINVVFLFEGAIVAVAGVVIGSLAAVGYCALVLYGLRTFWQGAVGGTQLQLFVNPVSVTEGAAGGFLMGLSAMWWALHGLRRLSPRSLLAGTPPTDVRRGKRKRTRLIALVAFILGVLLLASGAMHNIDEAGGFFAGAALLLIAALTWTSAWIGSLHHSVLALDQGHSLWKLGARSTAFRPGRAIAGIALIASATFLIVGLDAFRQRVVPTSDPHSGTGGFALAAESELPILYDPNTPAGRENLNLIGVPESHFFSFRLRPGDDASCLNLYQPRNPRVLGAPDAFLRAGRFRFVDERENPWLLLDADPGTGPMPAIADANSITYILHRKVGDEFVLNPDSDHPVRLKLVAALEGSMLQSELIVSERNFVRAFPQEQGYRFFLIDTKSSPSVLENALSDYGFDATSATERLAAYRQVENTYLSTFQALGGIGLLLGTVGLAAVLLRNVLERRRELALLRALGYEPSDIGWIVIAENLFIAGAGLAIGTACAIIAVLPTVVARGGRPPLVAIIGLLIAVPATALLSSVFAVRAVSSAPLLAALRAE